MCAPYYMCTEEYQKYLDDNPDMMRENSRALCEQQQQKNNAIWRARKNRKSYLGPATYNQKTLTDFYAERDGRKEGDDDGIRVTGTNSPPSYYYTNCQKYEWKKTQEEIISADSLNHWWEDSSDDDGVAVYSDFGNLSKEDADRIVDFFDDIDPKLGNIWAEKA